MGAPIPVVQVIQPIKQRALQLIKPRRRLNDGALRVEIVGPSDPSVVNWIAEAEEKLWKRL
jgi:hypothetical protein